MISRIFPLLRQISVLARSRTAPNLKSALLLRRHTLVQNRTFVAGPKIHYKFNNGSSGASGQFPLRLLAGLGGGCGLLLLQDVSSNLDDKQLRQEQQQVRFLKSVLSGSGDIRRQLSSSLGGGIKIDPNGRHPLGWASLHVAAVNGRKEAVAVLLEAGADPNIPEEYINIYHTAREKGLHSLDVMVTREEEFSNRLNLRANFRGCTPLHYAALVDDIEIVTILLEAGADPLRSNDYGKTPLDYAREVQIIRATGFFFF